MVTTHVSVLSVMSSGHGWVAAASQSVRRCRVLLGATQRLSLAVVESHRLALVVGWLCARPARAVCMYCQVAHRTTLCLPYHLSSPCSTHS